MVEIIAKVNGENEEVCEGIFEHYLPRFAGDIFLKLMLV